MKLILCAVYIFIGAILFALPNMSPRYTLFAVPVPDDFRASGAGRRSIAAFRTSVAAIVLVGVFALLLSPLRLLNVISTAVPLAILLTGGIAFYRQYQALRPSAVRFTGPREAELTATPERLPWFIWLTPGPFAMLAATAGFLYLNWDRIPTRFPVHWNTVSPDRWAERTARGVYGFLLFGAELSVWMLAMALAGWYGARRSGFRSAMLGVSIVCEYLFGLLFAAIALQPLLDIPIWVIVLGPMLILIPAIVFAARRLNEPGEPTDPTPLECWKAGIIYYNPDDSVLVVPKREGLGYTLNFANRWSWALIGSLAAVVASAFFVLP